MAQPDPFFSTLDLERFEGVIFDGFPYLIVHAALGINHIILLPRGLSDETLQWIAWQQRAANRLAVSLVLSADKSLFYPPEGGLVEAFTILFPGFPVSGSIHPCVGFRLKEEPGERASRLDRFIADHPTNGFRFGNPWKGGRDATIEEAQWPFGRDANGVPRGLRPCAQCGDSKGECLDHMFWERYREDVVVPVACRCENWNRFARCHRTLELFRLDANFFNPEDGQLWYVPGACALKHHC